MKRELYSGDITCTVQMRWRVQGLFSSKPTARMLQRLMRQPVDIFEDVLDQEVLSVVSVESAELERHDGPDVCCTNLLQQPIPCKHRKRKR